MQYFVDLTTMNNNDVFKKLRVALQLKDTDIVEILKLSNYEIGTSELNAFFRSEDHPNYKECGDQILRNFLNGLIVYKRGPLKPKNPDSPPVVSKPNVGAKKLKSPGIKNHPSRDGQSRPKRNF